MFCFLLCYLWCKNSLPFLDWLLYLQIKYRYFWTLQGVSEAVRVKLAEQPLEDKKQFATRAALNSQKLF